MNLTLSGTFFGLDSRVLKFTNYFFFSLWIDLTERNGQNQAKEFFVLRYTFQPFFPFTSTLILFSILFLCFVVFRYVCLAQGLVFSVFRIMLGCQICRFKVLLCLCSCFPGLGFFRVWCMCMLPACVHRPMYAHAYSCLEILIFVFCFFFFFSFT